VQAVTDVPVRHAKTSITRYIAECHPAGGPKPIRTDLARFPDGKEVSG
jgi:hypothetical protein